MCIRLQTYENECSSKQMHILHTMVPSIRTRNCVDISFVITNIRIRRIAMIVLALHHCIKGNHCTIVVQQDKNMHIVYVILMHPTIKES